MNTPQILPETGRGTAEGGGGDSPQAQRSHASPLRQPLRVCHLPDAGRMR